MATQDENLNLIIGRDSDSSRYFRAFSQALSLDLRRFVAILGFYAT